MAFDIERGLFALDVTDHHAILGVPVHVSAAAARKRYLQLAPRLHPDTCAADDPDAKEYARELMSKLVNPAYATLSNDRHRAEHEAVLRMLRERLPQQKDRLRIQSDRAQKLAKASNVEETYRALLREVSEGQYDDFGSVLARIEEASELNLIYLLRSQPKPAAKRPAVPAGGIARPANNATAGGQNPGGDRAAVSGNSFVDGAYRRAEGFLKGGNLPQAAQELKDALKLDASNSDCHALLGRVYLQQKQLTLAKVHLKRALDLNPRNPMAIALKRELDRQTGETPEKSNTRPTPKTLGQKSKPDKSGGGLFGGLFGGNKRK